MADSKNLEERLQAYNPRWGDHIFQLIRLSSISQIYLFVENFLTTLHDLYMLFASESIKDLEQQGSIEHRITGRTKIWSRK